MNSNEYSIHQIFHQSIYICEGVCTDILEDLEIYSKKYQKEYGTSRNQVLYVDSAHTTISSKLKHLYPFNFLAEQIKIHVSNYANELGYRISADNIHIDNMWFNISNQGDFNFFHAHGDCHFAGVFYVKTNPENDIIFVHPQYHNAQIQDPVDYNHLSYSSMAYKCIPSYIMVWRNYMIHSTPRQMEEGEKIVISFNTSIKKNYDGVTDGL